MTGSAFSENLTVLVVEEDVVLRNLIMTVLVREKYNVFETSGAVEALQVAKGSRCSIDLMITGSRVAEGSVRQIAEEIQKLCPSVKILQFAEVPFEMLERQGSLIPGAAFLLQPFSLIDFERKVNEICAGSSRSFF